MSEKELNKLTDASMSAKGVLDDEELKAVNGGCTSPECGPWTDKSTKAWHWDSCYTEEWHAACTEAFKNDKATGCGQDV